jgi:O-antigen/teichoic acid export membrane protein
VPPQIASYMLGNYVGSMLSLAANTLLPLLVLSRIGASANAYFAQAWFIAGSLQLIAINMTTSLTVEAAAEQTRLSAYARSTLIHSAQLLAPLVLVITLGAPIILQIFGSLYAAEGTDLLRLLALAALPNCVNTLYLSVARVQRRMTAIMLVQGALCVLGLGLSYALMPLAGITGVGWAWLITQSVVAAALALLQLRSILWPRAAPHAVSAQPEEMRP